MPRKAPQLFNPAPGIDSLTAAAANPRLCPMLAAVIAANEHELESLELSARRLGLLPGLGEENKGFARFWAAYPSCKRKIGKSNSRKIWESRLLELITDEIIAALEISKQADQWQSDGGKYIPMPQTWLNQAPWETRIEDREFIQIDHGAAAERQRQQQIQHIQKEKEQSATPEQRRAGLEAMRLAMKGVPL